MTRTGTRAIRTLFLIFAACCLGVSAFAERRVRNVITIPIPLPKNYSPPSLPVGPIDEGIRVCLVLPAFDADTSATWTAPTAWEDTGKGSQPNNETEVDRIVVNFSESTGSALPGIVKRLFPRAEVTRSQTSPQCELLLRVALQSNDLHDANRNLVGVTVTGTISAYAADGMAVATINGSGSGYRRKSIYWSNHTETRAIGEPALQNMLNHLILNLSDDPSLIAYIKTKAAERARPSDLETTARFDDSKSFFPNGRLDAGEQAKLLFNIRNRGVGPAFGVQLRISSTAKGIATPANTEIGDILPGATRDISVVVSGGLDIESALQTLAVETLEKRGYGGGPIRVELAIGQLKKPTIEIADLTLNDSGGRARGDGNGRPSNGEMIEATALIRNSGPGDAAGVRVVVESVPGVEIVEQKPDVAAIPVNAVREARFLIRLPVTFAGADLPLTVRAEEVRGAMVAQASRTATWPVELKRPAIELTYRLFDGNSPESRGDRDGVANNGETLELALTPVNRGPLAARDVSITIASRQADVTVNPESFQAGELPPFSEGAEHRVRVIVPRTLGRDTSIGKLPLAVSIAQRDFASNEQPIALEFKARRPEVVAEMTTLSPLIEGTPVTFALEVRNRGALAAEDVNVEVTCDNSGLELLEDSGTPARKLVIAVGSVGAQTTLPKIPIKAHIRRNLQKTATSLELVVQQADFPQVTTQAALNIQREEVTVISAAPATGPLPERPAARASVVPATVTFTRYDNGDRVNEESIALRFEVQSRTALETVRLEQNHRAIDLGTPKALSDQSSYAWQYEPLVHLEYGENVFEVIVVTTEGVRSPRGIIINRERPQGRVWVAAVGISKYVDKRVKNLDFARDDAVAVLAYYRQFGLPETQLIPLLDEQATLSNIKRNLGTELVNRATNPDDTVILYFAGHGERESDRGSIDSDGYSKYLLPYDADTSDLFSSALSMEELTRILQRLRPERVVLIIDSCFSGAAGGRTLFEPGVTGRAPMTDEFLARMATAGRGRVILTASSGQEVAQEGVEWHHGVFTHYLLEALQGDADFDGDGRVDIDEIYTYVAKKVAAATNGRQTPMKKAPNLTGTVVVGRRMRP